MDLLPRDETASFEYLANFTLLGSSAIWGIGISQTLRYFLRPPSDREDEPAYLCILVLWLCFADTLRQAFTIYSANTLYFNTVVWYQHLIWVPGVLMPYLFSALVALSTQTFFTYRIWILSEKKWFIPVIAVLPIFFQLCFPPILFYSINSNTISTSIQKDLLLAILITGAAVDLSISAGLCGLLWKHYIGERLVLKSTRSLLQRMMLLSVNTGMWTALISCATVAIFLKNGSEYDWKFFAYFHVLSPLYYTTVLANLNARSYLRKRGDPALPSDLNLGLRTMGGGVLAGGGRFEEQHLGEPHLADGGLGKRQEGERHSVDTLQPEFVFKSYSDERVRHPELNDN